MARQRAMKSAGVVKRYEGRYADQALTEPWSPPAGKSNLNEQNVERRFYDWRAGVVVENVGFSDYYFRRMTDLERASVPVCRQTGERHEGVWTYSDATCFVTFLDGRQSLTSSCRVTS